MWNAELRKIMLMVPPVLIISPSESFSTGQYKLYVQYEPQAGMFIQKLRASSQHQSIIAPIHSWNTVLKYRIAL